MKEYTIDKYLMMSENSLNRCMKLLEQLKENFDNELDTNELYLKFKEYIYIALRSVRFIANTDKKKNNLSEEEHQRRKECMKEIQAKYVKKVDYFDF